MKIVHAPAERRAFTLVEMLVVMAIVGILAGLLSGGVVLGRRRAAMVACSKNLQSIGAALTTMSLSHDSRYPALYEDAEGNAVPNATSGAWDGTNGVPWWARAFSEMHNSDRLDTDPSTPNELNLPPALPGTLAGVFHCRYAPPLAQPEAGSNADKVRALDASMSYGLNFNVLLADDARTPYRCVAKTDANYPTLGNPPATVEDKHPDVYGGNLIAAPSQFVLVAEADAENGTGGRVACDDASAGPAHSLYPARVAGRHSGRANALFADGHVADFQVGGAQHWSESPNRNTPIWTLPDD